MEAEKKFIKEQFSWNQLWIMENNERNQIKWWIYKDEDGDNDYDDNINISNWLRVKCWFKWCQENVTW